jgi:hypothetical protein
MDTVRPFRAVRLLAGLYAAASLATLAAIVALRHHGGLVTPAVWVRGTIVAASALLTLAFAGRAARGSRPAYRRLRIVSAAMLVAVAVIVALPGAFPVWMRLEQAGCGVLLLAVVVLVNGRAARSRFALD